MKKKATQPVEPPPPAKKKPASEAKPDAHDKNVPPEVKRQLNKWHNYMAEVESVIRRSIGS